MDTQGSAFLILILIAAAIAALVYVTRILKSADMDTPSVERESKSETEKYSPKPVGGDTVKKSDAVTKSPEEKRYVPVYQFTSMRNVVRCAHCDGENSVSIKICRICGNEINN